jgi:site-specific DNA-methyltransferase (adenine-specific)
MDFMSRYEDNFFDLAIVDPPYGIGEDGSAAITRNRPTKKYPNPKPKSYKGKGWDDKPISKQEINEIVRVSKNQIFFGANHYSDILPFPSSGWIYWDKDTTGDFSDGELAWTSFDKALRRFDFLWSGFRKGEPCIRIHPTQKPIALYVWILDMYATKGNKILDPYIGSGSSRIAANKKEFDFWGCENFDEYYTEQEKRFKEAVSMPLFDSIIPISEQGKMF